MNPIQCLNTFEISLYTKTKKKKKKKKKTKKNKRFENDISDGLI